MRALVSLVALAACVAHAQTRDPYQLLSYLGIEEPISRLLTCSQTLGPTKCLAALSAWRAKKAVESYHSGRNGTSEQFPWEEYNSTTNEQLYSQLCDGTEKLLQYRKMRFTIPGYTLELQSKEDGKINVDVLKSDVETARGSMSKLKKKFYNIVPLLLIPGLIMSAILPFVLPAMKLATVGSIMLNNMALTGAVFTLLRDNAFNDNYRPKVKYINAGWKNEEELYHAHEHALNDHENHVPKHHYEVYDDHKENHGPDHHSHHGHYEIHDDHKGHYSEDVTAYDHVGEGSKVVEQPHTAPNYWLKNYNGAVALDIRYDPHKRRG